MENQPTTAPLTPEVVSSILLDPDCPLYPSKIVVFCDDCGTEEAHEYMVSTEQTSIERLEVARAHLRTQGWQCDYSGDHCPKHRTNATPQVLAEVANERTQQDSKFGEQNHADMGGDATTQCDRRVTFAERAEYYRLVNDGGDLDWTGVLLEEVYEALAESDPAKLRAELVQVAAVAVAWIEAIDRRTS